MCGPTSTVEVWSGLGETPSNRGTQWVRDVKTTLVPPRPRPHPTPHSGTPVTPWGVLGRTCYEKNGESMTDRHRSHHTFVHLMSGWFETPWGSRTVLLPHPHRRRFLVGGGGEVGVAPGSLQKNNMFLVQAHNGGEGRPSV